VTDPAPEAVTTTGRRHPAGRASIGLLVVLTAIIVGLVSLLTSPAATASPLLRAQTAVGVIAHPAGQRVGLHQEILPGQGRIRAPGYDRTVVGSGVGAEAGSGAESALAGRNLGRQLASEQQVGEAGKRWLVLERAPICGLLLGLLISTGGTKRLGQGGEYLLYGV
jgi:hypothetical protein